MGRSRPERGERRTWSWFGICTMAARPIHHAQKQHAASVPVITERRFLRRRQRRVRMSCHLQFIELTRRHLLCTRCPLDMRRTLTSSTVFSSHQHPWGQCQRRTCPYMCPWCAKAFQQAFVSFARATMHDSCHHDTWDTDYPSLCLLHIR